MWTVGAGGAITGRRAKTFVVDDPHKNWEEAYSVAGRTQVINWFRSVARTLRPGGVYVFDRYMCSSWTDPARRWSWTRRRGKATIRATFEALKELNPVTQTFFEDMELEVTENGARHVYRQRHASRMVFPQELRTLVELARGFELCEWFYGFKPHLRLDEAHHPLLMVVVLRKT